MKVFTIGAGGWGTALSIVLVNNGHDVSLWEYDKTYAETMRKAGANDRFLPGIKFPAGLKVVSYFNDLANADLVVMATPSAHFRTVLESASDHFRENQVVVIATKGIERGTLLTMSQTATESLKKSRLAQPSLVTLSGPSHAEEVSRGVPTTVVVAGDSLQAAKLVQEAFNNPLFRVYTAEDHLGVELAGSLKNVVALAAGIADGLDLGDNSKAALMTRGLAEISRLGVVMGCKASTFAGLAGMGDLVVTCMSRHSRNRGVGERLGRGEKLKDIQKHMDMVAEGVVTAESALGLSKKFKVEMPICEEVSKVLFEDKDPRAALMDLMSRAPTSE